MPRPERESHPVLQTSHSPRPIILAADVFVEMACATEGPPVALRQRLLDKERFKVHISPPLVCALVDGLQRRGCGVPDAKHRAAELRDAFHFTQLDDCRPMVEHLGQLAGLAKVREVYTADDQLLRIEGAGVDFVSIAALLGEFL